MLSEAKVFCTMVTDGDRAPYASRISTRSAGTAFRESAAT